jgi:hypothetical protein
MTSVGETLSDIEKMRLIDAYHFLFNERLSGLFDRCHSALWDEFEKNQDIANLLRLFRHSSLIWRLRGDEKERPYLRRLASRVNSRAGKLLKGLDRERAYYIARASEAVLETGDSAEPNAEAE